MSYTQVFFKNTLRGDVIWSLNHTDVRWACGAILTSIFVQECCCIVFQYNLLKIPLQPLYLNSWVPLFKDGAGDILISFLCCSFCTLCQTEKHVPFHGEFYHLLSRLQWSCGQKQMICKVLTHTQAIQQRMDIDATSYVMLRLLRKNISEVKMFMESSVAKEKERRVCGLHKLLTDMSTPFESNGAVLFQYYSCLFRIMHIGLVFKYTLNAFKSVVWSVFISWND